MSFLRPDLWWIPLIAVLAIAIARLARRRRALAITTFSLLTSRLNRASRLRHLPVVFIGAALGLVFAGLLEPVIPLVEQQVEARGLDIVFVIDLSLSMSQPIGFTFKPGVLLPPPRPGGQRIDAIKDALRGFIARRPDDRIGVVVFSDHPYVVVPLTFDKEHLLGYFDLIDPKTLVGEGMTAIGDGIATGTFLLDRQSAAGVRNKVIIVFTDGASNLGMNPVEALRESTADGIRVHVVGVDLQEEQKRRPEIGQFIDAVRESGGQYYAANSPSELDSASRALDRVERGTLTTKTYVRNQPIVQWFALPAVAMLLLGMALRALPIFVGLH